MRECGRPGRLVEKQVVLPSGKYVMAGVTDVRETAG